MSLWSFFIPPSNAEPSAGVVRHQAANDATPIKGDTLALLNQHIIQSVASSPSRVLMKPIPLIGASVSV